MDRSVEPELMQGDKGGDRVVLSSQEPQLGPGAVARHGGESALPDRSPGGRESAGLDLEPQASRVASEPQQASGVVGEAPLVQDPELTGLQVIERAGNSD